MNPDLKSHHDFIEAVNLNPSLFEREATGGLLAVKLKTAILAIIDDAVERRDVQALRTLSPKLWGTFQFYHPPGGPVVDFIDLDEYVSLLIDCLNARVDPTADKFLVDYRAGIEADRAPDAPTGEADFPTARTMRATKRRSWALGEAIFLLFGHVGR